MFAASPYTSKRRTAGMKFAAPLALAIFTVRPTRLTLETGPSRARLFKALDIQAGFATSRAAPVVRQHCSS
jgi:hypothetical protein